MTHLNPPHTLADDLRQLTAQELSLPSRLRYVALLLAAAMLTAIVIALLIGEPTLPLRTSIALGVLAVVGLSWTIFATWVLTRKHVLLANHRVVAGRLAVLFCLVFVIGALAVGFTTFGVSPFAAAGLGSVMLAVAVSLWVRAKRRFEQLLRRRDELERLAERRRE
jgi:membrane associated rhomboid family serine protease